MSVKKIDRWLVGENESINLVLSETSDSTSGKTLKAFLIDEDGTEIKVGESAGAGAGTDVTIELDFATAGVTASVWYRLEVWADLSEDNTMSILPNPLTSNIILIFVRPAPADA